MAFPQVASSVSGNSGANDLIHTVSLPASIAAGDLLIAIVSVDTETVGVNIATWEPTGTAIAGANWLGVFARISDGTEGATVSIDLTDSEGIAWVIYRITGVFAWSGDIASATGSSAAPDSPSLTPSGGSGNILWIAATGWDGDVAHSGYPASYTGNQLTSRWADADGVGIAVATRELTAATENPGAFGIGASSTWGAVTIAVYGQPAATTGWFGSDTGCNCGCPPGVCLSCDTSPPGELLSVSVSAPANANCKGCVDKRQGTFVLRNPFAASGFCYLTGCCEWVHYLSQYWCFYEEPSLSNVYFGSPLSIGFLARPAIGVRITGSVGAFLVEVSLQNWYYHIAGTLPNCSFHHSRFSTTVASCADLTGLVVPFASSVAYEYFPTAGPGDYCSMDSATVTLL